MATTQTKRTYALAEFTYTACNRDILHAEIVAASIGSATIEAVTEAGDTVQVIFAGLLSSADEAALDGVIAAHQGEPFGPTPVDHIVNAETSDESGAEVQRAELAGGPLPEGEYLLGWSMQIRCTTAGGKASARITAHVNGGAESEIDTGDTTGEDWFTVSGSHPVAAVAGNVYTLRSYYQRTGAAGNAARVRRVRLYLATLE